MFILSTHQVIQAVTSQLFAYAPFYRVPNIDSIVDDVVDAMYKRSEEAMRVGNGKYAFVTASFKDREDFYHWIKGVLFKNEAFKMLNLTPREKEHGETELKDGMVFTWGSKPISPMDDFVDLDAAIQNITHMMITLSKEDEEL